MGNSLQDRTVLCIVRIRHYVTFLEYPRGDVLLKEYILLATPSFSKPVNEPGFHHLTPMRHIFWGGQKTPKPFALLGAALLQCVWVSGRIDDVVSFYNGPMLVCTAMMRLSMRRCRPAMRPWGSIKLSAAH